MLVYTHANPKREIHIYDIHMHICALSIYSRKSKAGGVMLTLCVITIRIHIRMAEFCSLCNVFNSWNKHIVAHEKTLTVSCVAGCCSVLQCVAVCCGVLQCVAGYSSVLQCVAGYYNVWRCVAVCSVVQCVVRCCSVLWCVAACCSVWQCVATSLTAEITRDLNNKRSLVNNKKSSTNKRWQFPVL